MSDGAKYADFREGIKTINEFLIDLIGALIPGIIFIFSIIFSIIVPIIIIFEGQFINVTNTNVSKVDLLVSNILQGWFWMVLFFTILILAYAIGNIFYRLDIKKIDRKSFNYEKRRCFVDEIRPKIETLLGWHNFRYIRLKYLYRAFHTFIYHVFARNKKMVTKNIKKERGKFIADYWLLLVDHLSNKDREILAMNKPIFTNLLIKKSPNEAVKILNNLAYFIYQNKNGIIVDLVHENDKTENLKKGKVKKQKGNTINETKVEEVLKKIYEMYEVEKDNEQAEIIEKFLHPYMSTSILKDYIKIDNSVKNDKADNAAYLVAAGWYFIFLLRSEAACDNGKDCQFPYEYYNTYLIKRGENHLLDHVKWCNDERSRSKNALNKLKLKLQLIAPADYNILVKNEAHIRMSSSSWYVSRAIMKISGFIAITMIVMLLFYIFKDKIFECFTFIKNLGNNAFFEMPVIPLIIAVIIISLPSMVFFLNLFIYNSAIKYLHYQRLREIFFVLQVYDEYFGEGCLNVGRRKNDRELLKERNSIQK